MLNDTFISWRENGQGGLQAYEVVQRVVWYQTPVGTYDNEADAAAACGACDLIPHLCITPVIAELDQSGLHYHILD